MDTGDIRVTASSDHGVTNKLLTDTLAQWTMSTISYHLRDLENRGLVRVASVGKNRIYYVLEPCLNALEVITT